MTQAQRDALALMLAKQPSEEEWVWVYLSNRLDPELATIPTRTADALEAAGLIETRDVATVGSCWVARLTDVGRATAKEGR